MANLDDILGKKKVVVDEDDIRIELDGMCSYQIAFGQACYFPISHGIYDKTNKRLTMVCVKGHEITINWEMQDG